jgi:putative ABC transport system permease protein
MKLFKIAWKNIVYKPLNTALCVGMLLFGVGIISLMLLMEHQVEQKFDRDLKNIDLVLGAKGSPLQLVLSAVYHIDAPTGNINYAEAQKLMGNPMVQEAIPLSYGDTYKGYRILGTTEDYINKYEGQFQEGELFTEAMQVVIGSSVAEKANLRVGDSFNGTHGEAKGGHVHDEFSYTVTGILEETNTVLDQLLVTNLESVWQVHSEEGHDHVQMSFDPSEMDITAVLLRYKSKLAAVNMPRMINEQTNMQAVLPGLEINRLFYMLGVGATTLRMIAGGIMVMAGFSVFFVLFNRMRERKFELALLRTVGYRPWQLFSLLVLEGILLALVGYVLGWLISRLSLYLVNLQAEDNFNFQFNSGWIADEWWLLLITILVGIVASFIPAWQAMRLNISSVLSEN